MITLLDYVISKIGEQDSYSGQDFANCGVPMFSGCEICHASLGGYNAYPTVRGVIRCADCVGDFGFDTVEAFDNES